jgi:putative hemolysin
MLGARILWSTSQIGAGLSRSFSEAALKITPLGFQRKVAVDFTVRNFRVKTIESSAEMRQVLALRHKVFHLEFSGKRLSLTTDKDQYDLKADHLAIFDLATSRLAGVYRLMSSRRTENFYSQSEFHLGSFLDNEGSNLELSRACIDKDYRNGVTISLLWKGIAEYAKADQTHWLFGLSSVNTTQLDQVIALHRFFSEKGILDDRFDIRPQPNFKIKAFDEHYLQSPSQKVELATDCLPPLFKTYIKAGARVCSQPVIDRDFACADWLTVLDLSRLTGAFDRRFMKN